MIRQNEAFDVSFSEKLVIRSSEVIQGQELLKKVKFRILSKVYKIYVKMKLLA